MKQLIIAILLLLSIQCFSQATETLLKKEFDAWEKSEQHLFGRTKTINVDTIPNRLRIYGDKLDEQDTLLTSKFGIIKRLTIPSTLPIVYWDSINNPITFIDTVQVRVLIYNRDMYENEFTAIKTCYMKREGEYLETYNRDAIKYIKAPRNTKVFYYEIKVKPDLIKSKEIEGVYIHERERVEVEIPKDRILQIFEIKEKE